ncbi:MAG: hypothetical protein P8104_13125, partial [Gammaproteobacteria bacterium]
TAVHGLFQMRQGSNPSRYFPININRRGGLTACDPAVTRIDLGLCFYHTQTLQIFSVGPLF